MSQRLPDMNKKKKTDDSRKKQIEGAQKTADSTKFTKEQQEFFDRIIASMDKHKKLLDSLK